MSEGRSNSVVCVDEKEKVATQKTSKCVCVGCVTSLHKSKRRKKAEKAVNGNSRSDASPRFQKIPIQKKIATPGRQRRLEIRSKNPPYKRRRKIEFQACLFLLPGKKRLNSAAMVRKVFDDKEKHESFFGHVVVLRASGVRSGGRDSAS